MVNNYQKIIIKLKSLYYDNKFFGYYIAITNLFWPYINNMPLSIAAIIMKKKHEMVLKYIYHRYNDIISKHTINSTQSYFFKNSPIWVCWLQGEEKMPEVPQQCLKSIRRHSNGHPVIVISLENYMEYITLPQFILNKQKQNLISNAHFSDIIRTVLLSEKGGCWIDSTILITRDLSEEVFNSPFYSIKYKKSGYYITENKWSNFFLVCQQNSALFQFIKDMFFEYLKKEERFIDYFLMDYFIRIGYESIPEIKKLIDNVPINNTKVHEIENILNKSYNEEEFFAITNETSIFKLSWKNSKKHLTKKNEKTFWGVISEVQKPKNDFEKKSLLY